MTTTTLTGDCPIALTKRELQAIARDFAPAAQADPRRMAELRAWCARYGLRMPVGDQMRLWAA